MASSQSTQLLEQVIEQQPASLLDQIVAKQAEVASRYQPVMSPADAVKRSVAIKELKVVETTPDLPHRDRKLGV